MTTKPLADQPQLYKNEHHRALLEIMRFIDDMANLRWWEFEAKYPDYNSDYRLQTSGSIAQYVRLKYGDMLTPAQPIGFTVTEKTIEAKEL